ncbi:hypothetical protein [Bartonella sp. LJL80]
MVLKTLAFGFFFVFTMTVGAVAGPYQTALTDFSGSGWQDSDKNNSGDDDSNPIPLPGMDAGSAVPTDQANTPPPAIEYDIDKLPAPVKLMRQKIIDAAKTGDVNNLKNLFGNSAEPTQLSVGDDVKDPIAFIKQQSGDGQGLETLAILIDLFNSGYVHLDEGENEEIYVWPYFVAIPVEHLTNPQLVQLFQIMTAGDLEQMKEIGTYAFYRIGITPDGKWRFFVTGD